MKLEVLNLALQAIELLRPIVVRVKKHDRSLARQITDAANSSVLNTGEGALSDPGTRRSRYQSAAGSANEVRVGVLAAIRWGYISQGALAPVLGHYDREPAARRRGWPPLASSPQLTAPSLGPAPSSWGRAGTQRAPPIEGARLLVSEPCPIRPTVARSSFLSEEVRRYLIDLVGEEPAELKELRRETQKTPSPGMQIGPDQGRFLHLLAELTGTKRAIEVGVFTGYSSLCVASALPPDGRLVACDVSEEWTNIARRYWQKLGLADRIELRLGEAIGTLDQLIENGGSGGFDFAFIDADKENYDGYYERCLTLLRPGGLVAVDNALWGGRVASGNDTSVDTRAIRALNAKAFADERVSASLVPIGDGVLLARKLA